MKKFVALFGLAAIAGICFAPAASAGWKPSNTETAEQQHVKDMEVAEAIVEFKKSDPAMVEFFKKAYGYAVFPTVAKAGIGIGAAHGTGKVYEKGAMVGKTTVTQVTIGFQLGGQAYREIIFFEDKAALDHFKGGNFELGAQASAVAATAGASADADYSGGVAIFTLAKGGLMYEASVGGQKFSFDPN
jgi:lipid-binding SYLF domain-containing protein